MSRQAPVLAGLPLVGHLLAARRDPLDLLRRAGAVDAPLVRLPLGPVEAWLVTRPSGARRVLQENATNYDKETRSTAILRRITGLSVLTANGEEWRRRRQRLAPMMNRAAVFGMQPDFQAETARWQAAWDAAEASGLPVDAWADSRRFTLGVVARTLFGVVEDPDHRRLAGAMDVLLQGALSSWLALPFWIPSPARRRFARAVADARETTRDLLCRAMAAGSPGPLLRVLAGEAGPDPDALLPECVTFLLAGHDTTACALAWTLQELALHPDHAETVCKALDNGDTGPLELFWREVLRLHPPIWILERRALAADEIDGCSVPAGASVLVSPWQLHRNPAHWPDPDVLRPGRHRGPRPEPGAWLPFGYGSRHCPGESFAHAEGLAALAVLLQRFSVETFSGAASARPMPALTLCPAGPIALRLRRRR